MLQTEAPVVPLASVQATKGKQSISFYTMPEYEEWKENNSTRGWSIKYYKVGPSWAGLRGWGWPDGSCSIEPAGGQAWPSAWQARSRHCSGEGVAQMRQPQ